MNSGVKRYASEEYVDNKLTPHNIHEVALINLSVEELEAAWAATQANEESSIYIEVPNFNFDKENYWYEFELNNKKYPIISTDIESNNQNQYTFYTDSMEYHAPENNISYVDVLTSSKINWEYDNTKALVQIYRINDDESPIFTSSFKLLEKIKYSISSDILDDDLKIARSISVGRNSSSEIGWYSSAIGENTIASAEGSHAEGDDTTASAYASHAEGSGTVASGLYSHAESYQTIASGNGSHAEGCQSEASGNYSHAEGDSTASGSCSHAEGWGSKATSQYSHAEGSKTTASGYAAHAEGSKTTASGQDSHAEGYGTIASGDYQHVQGKYNIEDAEGKYAHIVGNGAYNKPRSNAHTLDWYGNAEYQGDIKANACGGENPISLVETYNKLSEKITSPTTTATVGQVLSVKVVDENNIPTEWETTSIPTKTSELTNDSGFLTEHQDLSNYATKSEIPTSLSQLSEDETHRLVTDEEKATWNAKVDIAQGSENYGKILIVDESGNLGITTAPASTDVTYNETEQRLELSSKTNLTGNVSIDPTLSISGEIAEAKAVGDAINEVNERIDNLEVTMKEYVDSSVSAVETSMNTHINNATVHIPTPTADDNNKILRVVDGVITWVALSNAEDEVF